MKPLKTLLFTLGVFVLLASTMWLTPDKGIKIGKFIFQMPTLSEMLIDGEFDYVDVSDIIEKQFDIDSLIALEIDPSLSDTIIEEIQRASYDSLVKSIHKIEITTDGRQSLYTFFSKLKAKAPTRIIHYGDSQIEGDRMTSFIRNKFQVKFGGTGLGLRPALQPYNFIFNAVQKNSENWKRFPIYGKIDTLVEHNRYGIMGAFSRFAPPVSDSIPFTDSIFYESELSISKTNISYKKTRDYKRMRLFYGNTKRPVTFQLLVKGEVYFVDTLISNLDYAVVECILPDSTGHIAMKFSGWDSPDIYGIELAAPNGVIVDNIGLRGSSGTIFTKTDFIHSQKMYNDLNPGLLILQFGGNVMPYIKDQKAINNYKRWFASQIKRLKKICPDAGIIVIGPSDMSNKAKDKFVTYEYLPSVVKALKETAISNGCGYWDMYEAMGGRNSMPSWVNAEPELARPDYTHFNPRGARLIANMFYNALIFEYNYFLKSEQ